MDVSQPIFDVNKRNIACSKYAYNPDDDTVFLLQMYYIFISLFWLLLISYFDLWREKLSFILFLPLFAFFITFLYIEHISIYVEENMMKSNYLSLGLILALPMLSWMLKEYNGNRKHFITIIVLALVLSLLTFVDIWVPENRMSIYRHIRSSLQVMSVSLFIYALCAFYFYSYTNTTDFQHPGHTGPENHFSKTWEDMKDPKIRKGKKGFQPKSFGTKTKTYNEQKSSSV
jgi:hypothetical protein